MTNRKIDHQTPLEIIESHIKYGQFEFYGRTFSVSKTHKGHELAEVIGNKSKKVLTIYPEENLSKTILKYIGFDLSLLQTERAKQAVAIGEIDTSHLLVKRRKEMFLRFQEVGVQELDIVCYLKKSKDIIGKDDLDHLEEVFFRVASGKSPVKKYFPPSNRALKNYRWNIKKKYPNTKVSRVIYMHGAESHEKQVRDHTIFLFLILFVIPFGYFFLYILFILGKLI